MMTKRREAAITFGVLRRSRWLLEQVDSAEQNDPDERRPAEHVRAVESGERIEQRAEHPRRQGEVLVGGEVVVVVALPDEEDHAEQQGDGEPAYQPLLVATADGADGELHEHA